MSAAAASVSEEFPVGAAATGGGGSGSSSDESDSMPSLEACVVRVYIKVGV